MHQHINEIIVPLLSAVVGGIIVSVVNIFYIKPREAQLEYKLKTYREFFTSLDEFRLAKTSNNYIYENEYETAKRYSHMRNALFLYSSDEFLNQLIDFEEKGLNIMHDSQDEFDKELQKLVMQARKELKLKRNDYTKWNNKFYFANFDSNGNK